MAVRRRGGGGQETLSVAELVAEIHAASPA